MVQPWIPPLFLVDSFADRTAAELVAQERKGVDARIVTVAPPEAQAVASDRLDVLDRNEHRNALRLDPELARPLVGAGRARAVLAEIADRIHALVPVAPLNAEDAVLDPVHVLGFDGVAHGLLLPSLGRPRRAAPTRLPRAGIAFVSPPRIAPACAAIAAQLRGP